MSTSTCTIENAQEGEEQQRRHNIWNWDLIATMTDYITTNRSAIEQAENVQRNTKDALFRVKQQALETEDLGFSTLDELRRQRSQMEKIQVDATGLNAELSKTAKLQNRLDRWAGGFLGGGRRAARKEAKEEMAKNERARKKKMIEQNINIRDAELLPSARTSRKENIKPQLPTLPIEARGSGGTQEPIDDECRKGLERVERNDEDIEAMLDETADVLDRLAQLSANIAEENQRQKPELEAIADSMDDASRKQAFAQARMKRILGRGRRRQNKIDQEAQPTSSNFY